MHTQLKFQLYTLLKRFKQSRFEDNYRWLMKNQYRNFSLLAAQRRQLLEQLVTEAYQQIPAYRERFLNAGFFRNDALDWSRFTQVVSLTREDLVEDNTRFFHPELAKQPTFYTFKTGGSTGSPIHVGQNEAYRDWFLAGNFFFNSWSGQELGTPYFFLWSALQDIESENHILKDKLIIEYLQGRRLLNCRVTSPEIFSRHIQAINEQTDCHYMVGYAYQVYALACHSIETGQPINRPLKGIFTTAEGLTDPMRQVIQSVFNAPVFNRYGCRDAGDLACECPEQNGLHINPLYSYIEVVDEAGNPVPYGEEGRLLVTNLHNYAMPLIRYAIGDTGIMRGPEKCDCGREWETLTQITGRTFEQIHLPNGKSFGGGFMHMLFHHLPYVKRYQVHQLSTQDLVVKLRSSVPNYVEKYTEELEKVHQSLQIWTGFSMNVRYEQTDDLDKTPTGKELIIINKMNSMPDQHQRTLAYP